MVHQYQLNGYNIVLDSCSGSVHVVDDVAYDVIAMYKEHSADEIVAAMLAKMPTPRRTEADLRHVPRRTWPLWKPPATLWAPDVYKDTGFRLQEPPDRGQGALPPPSPTPATSTAPTASPRRAAIRATAP